MMRTTTCHLHFSTSVKNKIKHILLIKQNWKIFFSPQQFRIVLMRIDKQSYLITNYGNQLSINSSAALEFYFGSQLKVDPNIKEIPQHCTMLPRYASMQCQCYDPENRLNI